jgi:hypothetical protein
MQWRTVAMAGLARLGPYALPCPGMHAWPSLPLPALHTCPAQVIVNARKPDFFTNTMSLYEVVTEDGLMRPSYSLKRGGVYCGGSGACGGFCGHAACCPTAAQGPLTASLHPAYAHLPC